MARQECAKGTLVMRVNRGPAMGDVPGNLDRLPKMSSCAELDVDRPFGYIEQLAWVSNQPPRGAMR